MLCRLNLQSGHGHATTQLNCTFIDQPAKPLCNSFLSSCELILSGCHPRHLTSGDHSGGHRFEKEFAKSHDTNAECVWGRSLI